MIKKVLMAIIFLVLMLGVVHASDNVTDTADEIITDDAEIEPPQEIQKEPEITIKETAGKEKTKVKIKATVRDSDGNAIKNATVNFKIKGKNYKAASNENGVAEIDYKLPKAKFHDLKYKQKKHTLTKKILYKTELKVKVTVNATDNYTSGKAASKVISKKTVLKKYRFKKKIQTEVLPWKFGDHTYKRGKVSIQIICDKEDNMDVIWIAAEKSKSGLRLVIASKLYSNHNGKWKWDKKWKPMMSDHDTIIEYYDRLPETAYIKVKCEVPFYKLIKKVEY